MIQFSRMSEIMNKFRIKYTSLTMVDGINVQPRQETQVFFDQLISEFRLNDSENSGKLNFLLYHLQCNILKVIMSIFHRYFRLRCYEFRTWEFEGQNFQATKTARTTARTLEQFDVGRHVSFLLFISLINFFIDQ